MHLREVKGVDQKDAFKYSEREGKRVLLDNGTRNIFNYADNVWPYFLNHIQSIVERPIK